jgi:hypothetical protein
VDTELIVKLSELWEVLQRISLLGRSLYEMRVRDILPPRRRRGLGDERVPSAETSREAAAFVTREDAVDGFRDWVRVRISLAKRLNPGGCGGSYGDAMLVLSALLSGRAADLWPGKGKDRRRFVEA